MVICIRTATPGSVLASLCDTVSFNLSMCDKGGRGHSDITDSLTERVLSLQALPTPKANQTVHLQ